MPTNPSRTGPRILRRILTVVIVVVLVILLVPIPIPLDGFRAMLATRISQAMKKPVSMEGPLRLTTGLSPKIEIGGLRVQQYVDGRTVDFINASNATARLRLLPLLAGRLDFSLLDADAFHLELHGRTNATPPGVAAPSATTAKRGGAPALGFDAVEIRRFLVTRIHPVKGETLRIEAKPLSGFAGLGQNVELHASGFFQGETFDLTATGGTLVAFLAKKEPWPLAAHGVVGGMPLSAKGPFAKHMPSKAMELDVAIKGEDLRKPGAMFDANVPDLGAFDLAARLVMKPGIMEVGDIRGTVSGSPVKGSLVKTADGPTRAMDIALTAREVNMDAVRAILRKELGFLEGTVSRVDLTMTQSGRTPEETRAHRRVEIVAKDGDLEILRAGKDPLPLSVSTAEMKFLPGEPLRVEARTHWSGEDVQVKFSREAGDQPGDSQMVIQLSGAGAILDIDGAFTGVGESRRQQYRLKLAGGRIGDLSNWLAVSPDAGMPYEVAATYDADKDLRSVREIAVNVGDNDLRGSFTQQLGDEPGRAELIIQSKKLDVDDVTSFLLGGLTMSSTHAVPEAKDAAVGQGAESGLALNLPVWPERIALPDMDLNLQIDKFVAVGQGVDSLKFEGSLKEGSIERSSVNFAVGKTTFEGAFALDLLNDPPVASLTVSATDVDVGDLLHERNIATNMDFDATRLHMVTLGKGRTWAELLAWSEFSFQLDEGRFTFHEPGSEDILAVDIESAGIEAGPDKPVLFKADARYDDRPISVRLESAWAGPGEVGKRVPLSLEIKGERARLALDAVITVPFTELDHEFSMTFEGDDLSALSPRNGPALPAIGPYAFHGALDISGDGYTLSNLHAQVGTSELDGFMSLTTATERPRFDVALTSEKIQINDLALGKWMGLRSSTNQAPPAAAGETNALEQLIHTHDGRLVVDVKSVLSGEDELGAGLVVAVLENGQLMLDPVQVKLPGGELEASLRYAEVADGVDAEFIARARQYDYGILARRLKPESKVGGLMELDLLVRGKAPTMGEIPAHANGHVYVAAWPEKFDAKVFDLWAANVFSALMTKAKDDPDSKVNCIACALILKNGVLSDEAMIIDTTNVRVVGHAKVDFRSERFKLSLEPRSKSPRFFALELPVRAKGSFNEPKLNIGAWNIVKTLGHFTFSVVTVPVRWLYVKPLAKDGSEDCAGAMRDFVEEHYESP